MSLLFWAVKVHRKAYLSFFFVEYLLHILEISYRIKRVRQEGEHRGCKQLGRQKELGRLMMMMMMMMRQRRRRREYSRLRAYQICLTGPI